MFVIESGEYGARLDRTRVYFLGKKHHLTGGSLKDQVEVVNSCKLGDGCMTFEADRFLLEDPTGRGTFSHNRHSGKPGGVG